MRFFFATGEPSGEYHAVELVRAMRKLTSASVEAAGIGAERMRAAGFDVWLDHRTWSSVGWLDALEKIPRLAAHCF